MYKFCKRANIQHNFIMPIFLCGIYPKISLLTTMFYQYLREDTINATFEAVYTFIAL